MDTGSLVVELVKAGAWPVASIVLATMFRTPLTNLVHGLKLRRLKRGDWEAEFDQLTAETKREVAALPAAKGESGAALILEAPPDVGEGTAAVGAIVTAWNEVESAMNRAAVDTGVTAAGFPEKLRALANKGVLEIHTVDAVTGLRMLRNLAVHAPEPVEPEKAKEFVRMANAIMFALSMNAKKYTTNK